MGSSNDEEHHVCYGVLPCLDLEKGRMEIVDRAPRRSQKKSTEFEDEVSPTWGELCKSRNLKKRFLEVVSGHGSSLSRHIPKY